MQSTDSMEIETDNFFCMHEKLSACRVGTEVKLIFVP